MAKNWNNLYSMYGEALNKNSLLAARRSSEAEARGGTRSRRLGFFAYFLFPKKVGEKAVSIIFYNGLK